MMWRRKWWRRGEGSDQGFVAVERAPKGRSQVLSTDLLKVDSLRKAESLYLEASLRTPTGSIC